MLLGTTSVVLLFLFAAVETPSPVGCISTLPIPVPWTSPYWWLLILAHTSSSLLAAVECGKSAVRSHLSDKVFTAGVSAFCVSFLASTAFWVLMAATLVTSERPFGAAASEYVFPITTALTATALTITAGAHLATLYRARKQLNILWSRWIELQNRTHPSEELASRREIVGPWWQSPTDAVHQLKMQVADNELSHGQGRQQHLVPLSARQTRSVAIDKDDNL